MQTTINADFLKGVVQRAEELGEALAEAVETATEGAGIGMAQPSREELAAFFFKQQKLYPPEPWITPDGRTVVASPWVLALGVVDGGDEWIRRFLSFINEQPVMGAG